ncbi:MAG: hypothetical protein JWN70_5448, partial [Planctomycetaceae bacterium]|nr:hypothetical protein [Planctomycetaceae bacterium]
MGAADVTGVPIATGMGVEAGIHW